MIRDRRCKWPIGMSLLELLIVLVIIALLISVVSVKLSRPLQKAKLNRKMQELQRVDSLGRAYARQSRNRVTLSYALSDGAVGRWISTTNEPQGRAIQTGDVHIRVRFPNGNWLDRENVDIDLATDGSSKSYCLEFSLAATRRFVIVCGESGQWKQVNSPSELDDAIQPKE